MVNNKTLKEEPLAKKSLFNIYPYLLKDLNIDRANHVWIIDTTTILIQDSFCFLNVIMDVASRKILAWSIVLKSDNNFCTKTLNTALEKFSKPEILNLAENLQYISINFIDILNEKDIQISVSPKAKCPENVYIERFWRSLKYEEVYLRKYTDISEAKQYINAYIENYNKYRKHSSLSNQIPDNIYYKTIAMSDS